MDKKSKSSKWATVLTVLSLIWGALDIIGRTEVFLKLPHFLQDAINLAVDHPYMGWGVAFVFLASTVVLASQRWPSLAFWRKNDLPDSQIVAECNGGLMPAIVPPEGLIYHIHLNPMGGQGHRVGQPGTHWDWTFLEGANPNVSCYVLSVRNYGPAVVRDIELMVRAGFIENLRLQDGSQRSGNLLSSKDFTVRIPALLPQAADVYRLYLYNGCPHWVEIQIPPVVEFTVPGTGNRVEGALNVHYERGFPMMLSPREN